MLITYIQTHIHIDQTLKMRFSDSGDLITCKPFKISISKIWPQNNIFSTITWVRESKNANIVWSLYFCWEKIRDWNYFCYPLSNGLKVLLLLCAADLWWLDLVHFFARDFVHGSILTEFQITKRCHTLINENSIIIE